MKTYDSTIYLGTGGSDKVSEGLVGGNYSSSTVCGRSGADAIN